MPLPRSFLAIGLILSVSPVALAEKPTIGLLPKLIGIDFFNAAEKGAEEAAAELGVELVYDGPDTNDVSRQAQMVETWTARRFDAIAVAPNDPVAIAPSLTKARRRNVKTLTWDADALVESRDYFINQADPADIAMELMDGMAEGIGPEGKYIVLTGSLTANNQNIWMKEMERIRSAKYPRMKNLTETPLATQEDQALATQVTIDALKSYPDVQGIFAITSVALPGAAEALRKTGAAGKIFLTGLSTPNSMRPYFKDGTVKRMVLWSPVDLGYLTVHAAKSLLDGKIGEESMEAGRLGTVQVRGDEILLGKPTVFTPENIDDYDF